MRFHLAFSFVFCICATALHAQDAASAPKKKTVEPETTSSLSRTAKTALQSPLPYVPDLAQLDQMFKQTSLGKAADEHRMHIEWRKLRNMVANDPEIISAKATAESASTDREKREKLRDYYIIYYGKMRAFATTAEMKRYLDERKGTYLSLLAQPRVRPTVTEGDSEQ